MAINDKKIVPVFGGINLLAQSNGPQSIVNQDGTTSTVETASLVTTGSGGGGGTGDATAANQVIANTRIGDLTEAAPGADAAGSLSAKLRQLTKDLSSFIAKIPVNASGWLRTAPTTSNGSAAEVDLNSRTFTGSNLVFRVLSTLSAWNGTNYDGLSTIQDSTQVGILATHPKPNSFATSCYLQYRNTALSTTGQVIATGSRNLYRVKAINIDATTSCVIKIYNKATAATSSDTPIYTMYVKPNSTEVDRDIFINGAAGLSVRASLNIADSDNTAPTTLPLVEIGYY